MSNVYLYRHICQHMAGAAGLETHSLRSEIIRLETHGLNPTGSFNVCVWEGRWEGGMSGSGL